MTISKISVVFGNTNFTGEGSEDWLNSQLLKFYSEINAHGTIPSSLKSNAIAITCEDSDPVMLGALPVYLKKLSADKNQNRKFLATANWLMVNKNSKRLTTGEINKALADSNQSRLSNASEALNQNVSKGFCQKEGKLFFVTEDNRGDLNGTA